jgi:pyruvate, orthophosphate dikinase
VNEITVWRVGPSVEDGHPVGLVGEKACALARLMAAGLNVPPFFVLTTGAFDAWREDGLSDGLQSAVREGIQAIEDMTGRPFESGPDPLSVAVRVSMPAALPAVAPPRLDVGSSGELIDAISETFESWDSHRAKRYRKLSRVPDGTGLAVLIQVMLSSDVSRLSSRDPADGSKPSVESPALRAAAELVERIERGPQAIEYVVDGEEVYLLQTSDLDVTPLAAVRIALDMAEEGILSRDEAVARLASLPLDDLDQDELVSPGRCLATGIGASTGIGSGLCVWDAGEAAARADAGADVVLVRPETSPRDVFAMKTARAIVTERGGEISHAAIFSREYGIPCVVGCGDLGSVEDGAELTVNGTTGEVFPGRHQPVRTTPPVVEQARRFLQAEQAGTAR